MMSELIKFIYCRHIKWPGKYTLKILSICSFQVNLKDQILLKDIDTFVEGKWSSYVAADENYGDGPYFFELETDAMAFKLRWI